MKRVAYFCGDRGIPVPGSKGASIHVHQLCTALRAEGVEGEVWAKRCEADSLDGWPLHALADDDGTIDLNGADFVYERYSLWHTRGAQLAQRAGIPFVLEVNSPLPEEARRHRGLKEADRAEAVARELFRQADGLVCVSAAVAEWVADLRGSQEGIWVVPNGVDTDRFYPQVRRHPSLPEPPTPLLAFCGSFRPWHGLHDLDQAMIALNRKREVHLLAVGDGPERSALQQRLEAAGLGQRSHFVGALAHAEVPKRLGGATVAVIPYPKEGEAYFSPLKLFEAMALGLPVVAADVGQIADTLIAGETGRLYPPGDAEALAEQVEALLSDPEEAIRMGARARAWILENATWRHRARQILENIRGVRARVGQ